MEPLHGGELLSGAKEDPVQGLSCQKLTAFVTKSRRPGMVLRGTWAQFGLIKEHTLSYVFAYIFICMYICIYSFADGDP